MPRAPLKRRHLNRNGPILRAAKMISTNSSARRELEQKLAHKPIGPRPNDSDDSDRLVVKGTGRRGNNVPRQEIYASGAVGAGDQPGAYPSRAQRRKNMTKATDEFLANEQKKAQEDEESFALTTMQPQPARKSPPTNGIVRNPTSAKQDKGVYPTSLSSAMKPPSSILRPIQPTPTRENSILGTLKPRRRQPSILQNLDNDSSAFDLEDEDLFLPDAESTPLNLTKSQPQNALSTPPTNPDHISSPRKRKFGASDVFRPNADTPVQRRTTSPLATTKLLHGTPEPSLLTVPVSTLRESGRRQRECIRDEDDIMAFPESSSSQPSSPAKPKSVAPTKKSRQKEAKPAPVMTTEELQALMPTKKRRTARERKKPPSSFDIPADSDSPDPDQAAYSDRDDESSFLPTKGRRKARRKERPSKPSNPRIKASVGVAKSGKVGKQGTSTKARAAATSKSKSSTINLITTTAPILTPSTSTSSRRNRETKSPSQLSTVEPSNINIIRPSEDLSNKGGGGRRPYGGSLRRGRSIADGYDKENLYLEGEPIVERPESEKLPEAASVVFDPEREQEKRKEVTVSKGKWADIDAWSMDFEDVEVIGSGSSSPMRR
ncbi:uncharacterized protein Z518_09846 [Rhinocladiella mackenziei CBS 650.93]|uniref:Uncharacterized protein n=1 Tax=Rhinocladiella mackenziei CBS 650.93 TaxID=1442369 RepID=A0A0D2IBZ0_9EURO|nr:uncharacterized protein Z518_09846 [Rhinocladiella mackenziei CBS 650.93]KIX00781.1 hypothetical protein Z518_09846 [Rhinocladiella mackenziei CBS 650.93]